ncbi:transposase [Marinobacter sp. LV10R520-4]|uniref:transposase n=1 Tax=unclassified Marinobacter TaxID=83889 RepID=UPI003A5CDB92
MVGPWKKTMILGTGGTAFLGKKKYETLKKKLWGNALWSPSYFAGSCGGAPISIIRQYIEQQQTPE